MPAQSLADATVNAVANVYFDGRCISHSVLLPGGVKKSVGVILPATLRFNTGAAERMECVAGRCEYRLAGAGDAWVTSAAGDSFSVPADSSFEIRVDETYHYICHID